MDLPAHLQALERDMGRLSPVQKILLSTDGSVTQMLEVITGSPVRLETHSQHVEPADGETAAVLQCGEGEDVNHRVVTIRSDPTGKVLLTAVSHALVSRLPQEFREDLMQADIPIGKILLRHRIEARREIREIRATSADPGTAGILGILRGEPVLSRRYEIIHGGAPLLSIREAFPYHAFLDERRVIIDAPSRIHLTLIDLHGGLGRVDGSVGLALEEPRLLLEASLSSRCTVMGGEPWAGEVAGDVAGRVLAGIHAGAPAAFTIREGVPRHVGLGSGTQMALSVGRALATLHGREVAVRDLARMAGRGGTSGIGAAAFEHGGFLVDGGHSFGPGRDKQDFRPSSASSGIPPAPVVARHPFPEDWKVILAVPRTTAGASGALEREIFRTHCPVNEGEVQAVCREILMRMLPGIAERDLDIFGASVNRIQDLGFKRVEVSLQGQAIRDLLSAMRGAGAACAGLSSFGPAVYAITDTGAREVEQAARSAMAEREGGSTWITRARNEGARVRVA
ncbi:MAG: chorismate pyruvate-lyase family protein [Methanomicrobiales archaeon]|nr:chorismate pyruvate-lyase family protein [Methanomicrobiales archaeon]